MGFRPVSLTSDLDSQILGLCRELFGKVPLPDLVIRLGGIDWLLAITGTVLDTMSLQQKLDIALWGNQALMQLCDRLAHVWLQNASTEERRVLEEALIRHKLMYK